MKLTEVNKTFLKLNTPRAGIYPIYTNEKGKTFVYMMMPSDPRFGGPLLQMGKGGIDEGESAEQAAIREGYEELGLISSNIKNISQLVVRIIRGKKVQYELTVFVAEVIDPDNFDQAGWESKWAGWVELDVAKKVSRKNQRQFLNIIGNQPLKESIDVDATNREIKELTAKLKELEASQVSTDWKSINSTKAKIAFLKSQIELSQKHGIEPEPETRASSTTQTSAKNWKDYQDSLRPFMETVKQHCQPYLELIDNNIKKYRMFRGLRGTDAITMTGRVRLSGRKPFSTGTNMHKYVNRYFQIRYGEPFRDAMFVSGKADFAKDYGNLFLVFPRGDFTFLWSPWVVDLYNIDADIDDAMYPDGDTDEVDVANYFRHMDMLKYQTTDIKLALTSEKEIMVRTQAYYGINLTDIFNRDDYEDDSIGDQSEINIAIKLIQELLDEN